MATWRPMDEADLPAVAAIADRVHPGFFEEPKIFAERRRLYPAGAWLLEGAGGPAGYVFSHPWRFGEPPALNTCLGALPAAPDTFYLHDLALLPDARGSGAGGRIVGVLAERARKAGYPTMSLVAVNASQEFWRRHGFEILELSGLAGKLSAYEPDARYMVRSLAAKSGALGCV